ncbi:MAG: glycoside-pentoside-hexuronide (GPH):cation symporter [Oscillospiraceae bacterium]|jgi:sugar (glycoside-pentoside-hexuronide) transporter|nr:glycoside-pentoside-hexuronide (GPH):cation symporter [Oscillospiraceae bacterium]
MNAIPKIKLGEKFGFCAFSCSSNIVYIFKNTYYLFFLTNVLKVNVLWAGIILTVGMIWDAVNDPIMGFWSVNHRFKNGEQLRPFALWYSVPWGLFVVLLFTDFGVSETPAIVIALVVYVLFEVFNTLTGIPYNSMSGLATDNDEDRRSINVFRNIGAGLGSAVGAVACLPLLKLFNALDADGNLRTDGGSRGFLIVGIIMAVIVIAGSVIHYFTTRERVKPISDDDERISVKRVTAMLFRCKSWWLNTLYFVCYGVINMLLMTSLTYYATYVLGSTSAATMLQAAFLLANIGGSFLVAPIEKRLGRRKTMLLGVAIAILGKAWFLIDHAPIAAMYVNAITLGISVAIAFVLLNVNRNDIVDIIEVDEGRRIDSMIATADNLVNKLAVAGMTQVFTLSLAAAGYNADLAAQPAAAIGVINAMVGWVPTVISVIMFMAAFFLTIEKDHGSAVGKRNGGLSEVG